MLKKSKSHSSIEDEEQQHCVQPKTVLRLRTTPKPLPEVSTAIVATDAHRSKLKETSGATGKETPYPLTPIAKSLSTNILLQLIDGGAAAAQHRLPQLKSDNNINDNTTKTTTIRRKSESLQKPEKYRQFINQDQSPHSQQTLEQIPQTPETLQQDQIDVSFSYSHIL